MSKSKYTLRSVNKDVAIGLIFYHVLTVYALFHRSRDAIWLCVWLSVLTAWVGVGLCYHRLLTHRAFETYDWFRRILLGIGTLSGQGRPSWWVRRHLDHHAKSDKPGDPHSPLDGFGWAHVWWLVFRGDSKDGVVLARGMLRDPWIKFIDRFYLVPQLLLAVLLFYIGYRRGGIEGAKSWFSWGIGARTTIVYHVTWFVNSVCHTVGYTNFETGDCSRNNPVVAVLAGGEGWHNNHHRFQRSARHGMMWWEIDPIYYVIKLFSWVGLAWNLQQPKEEGS